MRTVLSAIALGTSYGLLGVAVSAVVLATRTLHLALGPILVVGVLTSLYLGTLGVPVAVATLAGIGVAAVLSALLEPAVLRPLEGDAGRPRGSTTMSWLVGLAVAGAVIELGAARWLGTRQLRPDPLVGGDWSWTVAGTRVSGALVSAAVLGGLLAVTVAFVVARTGVGRRLRLVGASHRAAALSGVAPRVTRAGALAASGGIAAFAGMLLAPITFVGVGQGALFTVRGVAAAVVLGAGGPARALAGGLLLGAVEALGRDISPAVGGEVALAVAVVVLAVARGGELRRAWGRAW